MIIGMPISTFFGIMIWPIVYIIAAIIVYRIMKKQDDEIDDSEFEQSIKGRRGSAE
jgi:predicted membrane protein